MSRPWRGPWTGKPTDMGVFLTGWAAGGQCQGWAGGAASNGRTGVCRILPSQTCACLGLTFKASLCRSLFPSQDCLAPSGVHTASWPLNLPSEWSGASLAAGGEGAPGWVQQGTGFGLVVREGRARWETVIGEGSAQSGFCSPNDNAKHS